MKKTHLSSMVTSFVSASMFGMVIIGLVLTDVFTVAAQGQEEAQFSLLWGKAGELWSPQSRLPDFSFAGYRRGEELYRIPKETISVRDFGAKGDGTTDDAAAFRQALEAGAGKVIEIPPGRYLLRGLFAIRHSGTVLRGAGPERTVVVFQSPGEQLDPRPAKTDGNQPTTGWSWWGGLIAIEGRRPTATAGTPVVRPQKRGDNRLRLEKNAFSPGDEILLRLFDDPQKSLLEYLYRGQTGNISGLNNWQVVQVFRVREISANELVLDRPLRFDVRLEWRPQVERFRPSITDVGVEGICFDFPLERYQGHFREVGWNPLQIDPGAAHCWLRNLKVRNADNGPFVAGFFCTVEQIIFEADPLRLAPDGYCGHHGITISGHDCLVRDFEFRCRFIHDLTVQSASGCVFMRGKGIDLNFDHHRWAPYENLFTDIDAGKGSRVFASSGGGMRGNHSAAGATFWGIRTERAVPWPRHFGVNCINIVGMNIISSGMSIAQPPDPSDSSQPWLEVIPWERLHPRNLFEAQRSFRKASLSGSRPPATNSP